MNETRSADTVASIRPRLSLPCYDKPHRCPGWAGGGTRSARTSRCEGGRIRTRLPEPGFPGEFVHPGAAPFRFGHCDTCGVITWPVATRWLDWRHLVGWRLGSLLRRFRWAMQERRDASVR